MALLNPINWGFKFSLWKAQFQFVGAARRRRRKGKKKGRKGEEKGRKGKEKGRKRKENERRKARKKEKEERERKVEKEGVSRSELTRTAENPERRYKRYISSYSSYFTLRGRVMAYGFRSVFWANLYVIWFVCDCAMVKDWLHRVLGLSKIEHCVSG